MVSPRWEGEERDERVTGQAEGLFKVRQEEKRPNKVSRART